MQNLKLEEREGVKKYANFSLDTKIFVPGAHIFMSVDQQSLNVHSVPTYLDPQITI